MRDLNISLVQTELVWQNARENRARLTDQLESLEPKQSDLVVLPEMFASGFTMEPEHVAEGMTGDTMEWLARQASRLEAVVTGSLVIESDNRYFNRLLWMTPDGLAGHYDKRHLFRMAGEQDHYHSGKARRIFTLDDWRICPLICYDLRFPVFSRGIDEFDLLIYVANWPAARASAWNTLLPARAVENLCYSAGVNRVGQDGRGIDYAGDSGVWNYLGNALVASSSKETVFSVTLSGEKLLRYRKKFPAHLDADRFHLDDSDAG